MFKVIMIVEDAEYTYGTYLDENKANEVALFVREQRDVETYVEEA